MSDSIFEQIKQTDPRTFTFSALAFVGLLGPAILETQLCFPSLFSALPLSKLLLLAAGATIPVALLNIAMCISATKNIPRQPLAPGTPDLNASAGLFVTALLLYIDIVLQFFIGYSFRVFVAVALALELLVIIRSIFEIAKANRKTLA